MTPIKTKSISISAIMDDKNLSKIIADALNSSPGSSKRERAKSIISSLTRNRNDGMGGPGLSVWDGQDKSTVKVGTSPFIGPQINQPFVGPQMTQPVKQTGSSPIQPAPGISTSATSGIQTTAGNIQGSNAYLQGGTLPGTFILPAAPTIQPNRELNVTDTTAVPQGTASGVTDLSGVTNLYSSSNNAPSVATTDFTDQWYNDLSDADKKAYKPLYDAVKAGVGENTFKLRMFTNTDELKALPGMADIPDEYLPHGASLIGQINELDKNLKTELKIKELGDILMY
jgi:hypothetical protein